MFLLLVSVECVAVFSQSNISSCHLQINNRPVLCDTTKKMGLCFLPEDYFDGSAHAVTVCFDSVGLRITVNDNDVANGSQVKINCTKANLFIVSDGQDTKDSLTVYFTCLPIVSIEADNYSVGFSNGKFSYLNATGMSKEYVDVRWRGATSLSYTKKSYALKFKDAGGNNLDVSFGNLRSDNYWILDAMANDKARMRDRVSRELWNDFSTSSYLVQSGKSSLNCTRGFFVELFVNGSYNGIYCFNERMDRKQLQLKKYKSGTIHGVLYKSEVWSSLSTMPTPYDNSSSKWGGWLSSYPSVEDEGITDWKPLSDIIEFLNQKNTEAISSNIEERLDVPVWMDYFLYINLLHADDNMAKNIFMYIEDITKNHKFGIAIWDLDATWGRNYCGGETSALNEFVIYNMAFFCLKNYYNRFQADVTARYAQLRETYFAEENIKRRFESYFALFEKSGAAVRETNRWSNYNDIKLDFANEKNYVLQWISDRLQSLDIQYGYHPGLVSSLNDNQLIISSVPNGLMIESGQDCAIPIHTLSGTLAAQVKVSVGKPKFVSLPAGVFLINHRKVIVH